jgi:hypothetical protein
VGKSFTDAVRTERRLRSKRLLGLYSSCAHLPGATSRESKLASWSILQNSPKRRKRPQKGLFLWRHQSALFCALDFAGQRHPSPLISMVGTIGFEPTTSSVSRKRSNQLSYAPAFRQQVVYQSSPREEKSSLLLRCAPNRDPSLDRGAHRNGGYRTASRDHATWGSCPACGAQRHPIGRRLLHRAAWSLHAAPFAAFAQCCTIMDERRVSPGASIPAYGDRLRSGLTRVGQGCLNCLGRPSLAARPLCRCCHERFTSTTEPASHHA